MDAANAELQQLREAGIIKTTGTVVLPPPLPDTLKFESHALERMAERQISFAQATQFAEHARFAFQQRNGNQHSYFAENGFIVIRKDGAIATVAWLDDAGKKIVEVMKNHGF